MLAQPIVNVTSGQGGIRVVRANRGVVTGQQGHAQAKIGGCNAATKVTADRIVQIVNLGDTKEWGPRRKADRLVAARALNVNFSTQHDCQRALPRRGDAHVMLQTVGVKNGDGHMLFDGLASVV